MSSFGLQLLFQSVLPSLTDKQDAIILFLHWKLLTKNFLCLGTSSEPSLNTEEASELLPEGWHQDHNIYQLQYVCDKKIYLVKGIVADNQLIITIVRVSDEVITSATLNINEHISKDFRDFKKAFVVRPELESLIEKELIAPLSEKVRAVPVVVAGGREKPEPSPPTFAPRYGRNQGPQFDPFAVGGGDLDPLGRGEGGMLMDPRHAMESRRRQPGIPSTLPPGAVPPGARFDPFGPVPPEFIPPPPVRPGGYSGVPPRHHGFGEPDPDHLPPPGSDDMFM